MNSKDFRSRMETPGQMRHWVCGYCGTELMFESPDRLHTQSAYHLLDEHLDRILETYHKYEYEMECREDDCPGTLKPRKGSPTFVALICDGCGRDYSLWWAKIQAYRP